MNLEDVRARYRLAQMAGTSAEDAGQGWSPDKIAAIVRSWQDVAPMHDELARLRRAIKRFTDLATHGTTHDFIAEAVKLSHELLQVPHQQHQEEPDNVAELEVIREPQPRVVVVRDWLICANLAVTLAIMVLLTVLGVTAFAGAHYPPGQAPTPNAPVAPHPGVTR